MWWEREWSLFLLFWLPQRDLVQKKIGRVEIWTRSLPRLYRCIKPTGPRCPAAYLFIALFFIFSFLNFFIFLFFFSLPCQRTTVFTNVKSTRGTKWVSFLNLTLNVSLFTTFLLLFYWSVSLYLYSVSDKINVECSHFFTFLPLFFHLYSVSALSLTRLSWT